MIRNAVTEGSFYPSTEEEIFRHFSNVEKLLLPEQELIKSNCVLHSAILPHAGHIYSAYQTISFFISVQELIKQTETVVILHPNHRNLIPAIGNDGYNSWMNCIGEVAIDEELRKLLPYPSSHTTTNAEHSAEVLLPYLQYYLPNRDFKILPVCIGDANMDQLLALGERLMEAEKKTGRKMLVLASSDFSHFLTPDEGFRRDSYALQKIEERDFYGLDQVVKKYNLSICGYRAIIASMVYAGLKDMHYKTRVIARGHSGEVHPSNSVVDYISIALFS